MKICVTRRPKSDCCPLTQLIRQTIGHRTPPALVRDGLAEQIDDVAVALPRQCDRLP